MAEKRTEFPEPILPNGGRVCSACKFRRANVAEDRSLVTLCCRFPPTPVGGPVMSAQGPIIASDARFPVIGDASGNWCGEFVADLN